MDGHALAGIRGACDPDRAANRLCMPGGLFGAARLRPDVPNLVRNGGAALPPAVSGAGESARALGHELRISLLPPGPRADRCLSFRASASGPPWGPRALVSLAHPSS